MEENHPDPSSQPSLAPAAPDHPAAHQCASSTPQHTAAPRRKPRPPRPFCSRHQPRSLRRSPRPVLPLPSIKRPPLFPEKFPLTSLYLLDIIPWLVARRFELPRRRRSAEHLPFPAFQSLPRAAAWTRWMRRSSSAGLQPAGASRAFLVELRHRVLPRRR